RNNLLSGLNINENNNSKLNFIANLNELGNTLTYIHEGENALHYLNQSIKLADSLGLLNELKNAYKYRANAYKSIKSYKNALTDQENFQLINDSIFNKTKFQQIEELKTIYETEKK